MKKMKNNNINKTGLIIGAFCLIMVSCKAPSLTPTEKIELPKFYMDRETDSTTISSMSWKTFFPDTLLQSYIYNPQIEMFARFKMKSSFHKTKRII